MAKRSRNDTLTGGTGDINLQYLDISVTESAANTFTQTTANIPVLRSFTGQRKYQCMELLRAQVKIPLGSGATGDEMNWMLTTTSKSAMLANFTDPDIILLGAVGTIITTSGQYNPILMHNYDFSDGAGHGIILAGQQLFFSFIGTSQASAQSASVRLFYRFKNIGVDEFVGLAIQQQG